MKKRFLNVIFLGALLLGTVGTVTSCKDYDDDLESVRNDIAALQKSVSDLQAAISGGAVISSVTPTANGVTVTLSNGNTFTISNGQDGTNGTNGTNGADGKNGSVVTIGDNGNWFIDGVDTGKAAKGDKGDKGDPGQNGDAGQNGAPGAAAPTIYYEPGLEGAEAGFWVKVTIAADGTETRVVTTDKWQIAPEGAITAIWDTENGTLTLTGVENAEEGILTISLWTGLSSLAFVPDYEDWYGKETIWFNEFVLPNMNDAKNPTFIVKNNPVASYRLNPKNAKIDDYTFSFIGRSIQTRANADIDGLLTYSNFAQDAETGFLDFNVTLDQKVYDANFKDKDGNVINGKYPVAALKATKKDGSAEYISDYVTISNYTYSAYELIRKAPFEKDGTLSLDGLYDFDPTKIPTYNEFTNIQLEVKAGSSLDLNTVPVYVTWDWTAGKYYSVQSLGLDVKYEFSMDLNEDGKIDAKDKVLGADGTTDQQQYVDLDANGVVTIDRTVATGSGAAAIGKYPVFLMKVVIDGKVVAKKYILVSIVAEATKPAADVNVTVAAKSLNYVDLDGVNTNAKSTIGITTQQANDILGEVALDNNAFAINYGTLSGVYSDAAMTKLIPGVTVEFNKDWQASSLAMIQLVFDNTALKANNAKAYVKLTSNDPTRFGAINFTFTYSVVYPTLPGLKEENILPGTTNTLVVQGSMVGGSWDYSALLKSGFKFEGYTVPNNVNSVVYRITTKTPAQSGYDFNGNDYTDQKLGVSTLTKDITYDLQLVAALANGKEVVFDFKVMFRIPFVASLGNIKLPSTVGGTPGQLSKVVVIKDRFGNLVYGDTDGKGTIGLTAAGKAYGLTDTNPTFSYALEAYEGVSCTAAGEITVDKPLTIFVDKDLKSKVTVTFTAPVLTLEGTGTVTILAGE
jgi:hypothetical protein